MFDGCLPRGDTPGRQLRRPIQREAHMKPKGLLVATLAAAQVLMLSTLALLLSATAAFAIVIPHGTTMAVPTNFTGTLAAGSIIATTTPSGSAGTLSGTFKLAVYKETATGNLDFLYQFITDPGSSKVEHITGNNYGSFTTDVGYLTSNATDPGLGFFSLPAVTSGTRDPLFADRSFDGPGIGNVVAFDWPGIDAFTGVSDILVVKTNAKDFIPGVANAIDGGTVTRPGYQPAPEPGAV